MATFESNIESDEELDAVNDMLAAIGESPVSSLEGDANADVANCRRLLNKVNREVQSQGWTFNIEEDASLVPDTFSKLINYLGDYLKITTGSYTNRGGFVYDRTNKTDQFTDPITVTLVRLREYKEMPECFRAYIIVKASRRFNMRFFGAGEIEGSLQAEEQAAWSACQEYELDYGNFNMLDGDAWTGGRISR